MTPPVGGALWREVQSGGLKIGKTLELPAGVDVGVGIYAIHHNPNYYPGPFDFIPDRWIDSAKYSAAAVETAKAAYNPFSLGPRGCPGQALAMIEISLVTARILWQYDFRLAPRELSDDLGAGHPKHKHPGRRRTNEYQTQDCFTSWKEGPMIQFKEQNWKE
jgi:cytochrome P450